MGCVSPWPPVMLMWMCGLQSAHTRAGTTQSPGGWGEKALKQQPPGGKGGCLGIGAHENYLIPRLGALSMASWEGTWYTQEEEGGSFKEGQSQSPWRGLKTLTTKALEKGQMNKNGVCVCGGGTTVHTQHSSLPKSNKRGTTLEPHLSDHDPDSTSN